MRTSLGFGYLVGGTSVSKPVLLLIALAMAWALVLEASNTTWAVRLSESVLVSFTPSTLLAAIRTPISHPAQSIFGTLSVTVSTLPGTARAATSCD